VLLLVAACGGDDGASVDAAFHGDGALYDAAPNACDHTEQDDAGNDAGAEDTGLTAGAALKICGQIDVRAPDADGHVDVDRYRFAVAEGADFVIRVDSARGRDVDLITAAVGLDLGTMTSERSHSLWVGSHLVMLASLEAGDMIVEVIAWDSAAPDQAIPYELKIVPDDASTRCVPGAETPAYVEAADSTDSRGNDMAEVVYAPAFAMTATASTTDGPEPAASRATVTAGMKYKLGGTVADVTSPGDEYRDRDTYLIATGADTDELTVRVTWGGGADLDYFLMPVATDNADPVPLWDSTKVNMAGPEVQIGAVLPSTSYWLWIGGYDDTGVVWPKPYVIALCGESY
jgi:hypothetical protein